MMMMMTTTTTTMTMMMIGIGAGGGGTIRRDLIMARVALPLFNQRLREYRYIETNLTLLYSFNNVLLDLPLNDYTPLNVRCHCASSTICAS
jgi:hypothetical protein